MLAAAVAKLIDPAVFSTALILSVWVGRWWAALLIGAVLAVLYQLTLQDPSADMLIAAVLAFTVPALIGSALRSRLRRRADGNWVAGLVATASVCVSVAVFLATTGIDVPDASGVMHSQAVTPNAVKDPLEPLYASGQLVRQQPTIAQAQARQLQLKGELPHSIIDDVRLLLGAGTTLSGNLRGDFDRWTWAGDKDSSFDNEQWIEANADRIPQPQAWRFMQTKNERDSALLLQQMLIQQESRKLLAAQGVI